MALVVGSIGNTALADSFQNVDFYVSPDGSDAWSGILADANQLRSDGPIATLTRARDAVREFKKSKSTVVVVLVRGGKYSIPNKANSICGPGESLL